jgi:hypothetical protein
MNKRLEIWGCGEDSFGYWLIQDHTEPRELKMGVSELDLLGVVGKHAPCSIAYNAPCGSPSRGNFSQELKSQIEETARGEAA